MTIKFIATEEEQKRAFQMAMWSGYLQARGNVFYEHPNPETVAKRRKANKVARRQRKINSGR